jgi:histidinol dehydrogenase
VATPPGKDGSVPPAILAACKAAGVNEVYRAGGAQAVAALAFGTDSIPRVDKVVGPGDIFVTLAKKEISDVAGIDILAGPSEVVIVADETADPRFIAADMLSQAEHGPLAAAVLVTVSADLAEKVRRGLSKQLNQLERKGVAREALSRTSAALVVKDSEKALEIADELAPEHLELMLKNASEAAASVRNAGAVFVGPYTPTVVGDYAAGPSHVLPTGGTARFMSGLSVYDFYRRFSVIEYSKKALEKQSAIIQSLAEAEGLTAHLRSLEARFSD